MSAHRRLLRLHNTRWLWIAKSSRTCSTKIWLLGYQILDTIVLCLHGIARPITEGAVLKVTRLIRDPLAIRLYTNRPCIPKEPGDGPWGSAQSIMRPTRSTITPVPALARRPAAAPSSSVSVLSELSPVTVTVLGSSSDLVASPVSDSFSDVAVVVASVSVSMAAPSVCSSQASLYLSQYVAN